MHLYFYDCMQMIVKNVRVWLLYACVNEWMYAFV